VRETKSISFKMDSYNGDEGTFEGYAAVFGNIDSCGDIIEPGAFQKSLVEGMASNRIKLLALHNDCALPIGKPLELREDANGLWIKGQVSDTTMGRDVRTLLADGVLSEMSIGYDPVLFDVDEKGIRHLREIAIWEVSLVTWAANDQAKVTGYKSLENVTAFATQLLAENKAGKKISAARLKALKDARDALESIIAECEEAKGSHATIHRKKQERTIRIVRQ